MTVTEPVPEPLRRTDIGATPWSEARRRLAEAGTYWLATSRPDGRPHVMPLLAVWVDEALHFVASPGTRKARNLARKPASVLGTAHDGADLVVEGEAQKVSDEAALRRVAGAYAAKYDWPVEVRSGALWGEGAPTAGPPPYEVYRVDPATAFAFGHDETFIPTRWRFRPGGIPRRREEDS